MEALAELRAPHGAAMDAIGLMSACNQPIRFDLDCVNVKQVLICFYLRVFHRLKPTEIAQEHQPVPHGKVAHIQSMLFTY